MIGYMSAWKKNTRIFVYRRCPIKHWRAISKKILLWNEKVNLNYGWIGLVHIRWSMRARFLYTFCNAIIPVTNGRQGKENQKKTNTGVSLISFFHPGGLKWYNVTYGTICSNLIYQSWYLDYSLEKKVIFENNFG